MYSDHMLALSWLLPVSQSWGLKYGWVAFLCDQLFIKKKIKGEEIPPTQSNRGKWKAISGQPDDFASQMWPDV